MSVGSGDMTAVKSKKSDADKLKRIKKEAEKALVPPMRGQEHYTKPLRKIIKIVNEK